MELEKFEKPSLNLKAKTMKKKGDPLHVYLSSKKVQEIVKRLAKKISKEYTSIVTENNPLTIVVVLRGAFLFASDLVRRLTIPIRLDFVRLSSYGANTKSSGSVKMIKDIETGVGGTHVLIIDDIADTGHTLAFLKERLELTGPKSVKICTLLSKPSRREAKVNVDYVGEEVEKKFLVGYGLDYDEKYRNLSDICYIEGVE